jgi:hypothetical protein
VDVRPAARAGLHQPLTPAFDFWQTQTALVFGLLRWRDLDGAALPAWFGKRRTLRVLTNAGDDLNAFYDRRSLQFFSHSFGGRTVHSCESVDIVCHEQGHALLDAIRPDFFDVPFIEAAALHEAFGDCFAMLVGLADSRSRWHALAASPDLGSHNFLESLAEELGDAIRREFGASSAEPGALRRALNGFQWSNPLTLPAQAPATQLSREAHSFARVFAGCFYDTIRNIFLAGARTSAGLDRAATTAGRLLVSAIRTVPATPRLFEGVGRRMLQADIMTNGAANVAAIRAAFQAHRITLGAPVTSLPVPLAAPGTAAITATRHLREQLDAPQGAKLAITPVDSDMHDGMAHVTVYRQVKLAGARLKGLHLMVPAVARVEMRGAAIASLVGDPLPISEDGAADAQAFAEALMANRDVDMVDMVDMEDGRRRALRPASHEIRRIKGKKTIARRGFVCGCRG